MLSAEYAVKSVGLFSSFSRGDVNKESDIDMLVEFSRPIGWKFFTLQILLEETFGKKVVLITERSIRPELKPHILTSVEYVQ